MNKETNSYINSEGNINMQLVSNLTGTFTAPLVQRVWEQSGYNEVVVDTLFKKFEKLFDAGSEAELMDELKLLCGILGQDYPDEIILATKNESVRNGFIISFLSDYDDSLLDIVGEENYLAVG